tara:strand:- start:760 stop:1023 length:264 start_codon:yes stop_codon:yes gene_type:complete
MEQEKFNKALRFIAEEKASLKFAIIDDEELDIKNPKHTKYINDNISEMIKVFDMYECYPQLKWSKKIKASIKKEWEFINNLIKNLKQ